MIATSFKSLFLKATSTTCTIESDSDTRQKQHHHRRVKNSQQSRDADSWHGGQDPWCNSALQIVDEPSTPAVQHSENAKHFLELRQENAQARKDNATSWTVMNKRMDSLVVVQKAAQAQSVELGTIPVDMNLLQERIDKLECESAKHTAANEERSIT